MSRLSIRCRWSTRGELGRDRAADLLGRRVRRPQLRELLLELLEPPQPLVVVGVGQRRVVEHEVAPARLLDLLAEPLVLLARLAGWPGWVPLTPLILPGGHRHWDRPGAGPIPRSVWYESTPWPHPTSPVSTRPARARSC